MSNEKNEILLPTIPGCEFSGEIIEVGDYVTRDLKVGDKVMALLGIQNIREILVSFNSFSCPPI